MKINCDSKHLEFLTQYKMILHIFFIYVKTGELTEHTTMKIKTGLNHTKYTTCCNLENFDSW